MPTKKTDAGREYRVSDKKFIWTAESGDELVIPMRVKLGVLRSMSDRDLNDLGTMFDIIDAVAPGQAEVIDEMDVNDFQACFATWQAEYNALTGATPGESSSSPS